MKFKAFPSSVTEEGGISILLGAAFFDGVISCYIILHWKEQQATAALTISTCGKK